jgi:hypothetical protein
MKPPLFILISVLSISQLVKSQDTLVFRNGEQQLVKVLQVSSASVEYKKTDNADGPTYLAEHDRIAMIKYANGNRDVFIEPSISSPNPRDRAHRPQISTPRTNKTKGIVMTCIGIPLIAAGAVGIIIGIADDAPPQLIAAGSIVAAGGIALVTVGSIKIRRANKEIHHNDVLKGVLGFNPVLAPVFSSGNVSFRTGATMTIRF